MAFTVDDFQDLLRLLGQRPDWQAELRRQILTDELLELPALMRQLAERVDALTQQMAGLVAFQARTEQRIDELIAAQARFDRRQDSMDDHLGTLAGRALELEYRQKYPGRFGSLALRLQLLEPNRVAAIVDDAFQAGAISEAKRSSVLDADLVLTGRRRGDNAEVYLVAEVSVGVGISNVRRASERASILARLGRPTLAVVAGERISRDADELARATDVHQVLQRAQPPEV